MRLLTIVAIITVFATTAFADKYDEEAKAMLRDQDDKQHPVLPELAKVSPDIRQAVFRNVAEEADDCLGFYYSVGYCMKGGVENLPPGFSSTTGEEALQVLKHNEKALFRVAFTTTAAGGLDRETIKDTTNDHISDNAMTIHHDCGNLSMLMKDDKILFCQGLGQQPALRLRYWLKLLRK